MIWRPKEFAPGSCLFRSGDLWLFGRHPKEVREARELSEVVPLLDWAALAGSGGGYVAYEALRAFDPAMAGHASPDVLAAWACYEGFEAYAELAAPTPGWEPLVARKGASKEEYVRQFDQVQQWIRDGRTYQVNLTFPIDYEPIDASSVANLFCALCESGPPPYAALLHLGNRLLLSLSPELFFAQKGSSITCKPMKGTRPPGAGEEMRSSEKDLAENLMIVDMIRNDLGQIAVPGTVVTEQLFTIEHYPSVDQMTSTIRAEVGGADLTDVFQALFPCASVTGAPKVETTKIIKELEPQPRGAYCGAIGYQRGGDERQWSVAIRTLDCDCGAASARYGVGSGLVFDSEAGAEWEECVLKSNALNISPDFEVLETLRYHPDEGWVGAQEHWARMRATARRCGFPISYLDWQRQIREVEAMGEPARLRLLLNSAGVLRRESEPLSDFPKWLSAQICPYPVDSQGFWLRHKTTRRLLHQRAKAACPQTEECLLWNERGELVSFTFGNLALEREGKWFTPKLSSGCLPGVQREMLLRQGRMEEAVLYGSDLEAMERLWHLNSVRGCTQIRWTPADLPASIKELVGHRWQEIQTTGF